MAGALGRRVPTTWEHVEKYPLRLTLTTEVVERILNFPTVWREFYDQGREGACVGFASSEAMSVLNRKRYAARWLWNEAKKIDEWPDTNPGDNNGTSVRAAMDVLRKKGHAKIVKGIQQAPTLADGIQENRWASTVDELRTCIGAGTPVVMGTNWYSAFDNPVQKGTEWWLASRGQNLGTVRGGHSFMLSAASDKRQAFRTPNSWGLDNPQCWIPYEVVARLIKENGEATLITDRLDVV